MLGVVVAVAVAQRHGKSALDRDAGGAVVHRAWPRRTRARQAKKGACGIVVGPNTPGVAHPVLPCGVKIYLEFRGREVLTQVVDHGHTAPGRTFDVTLPVAKLLGLQGTQTIRWRFAS